MKRKKPATTDWVFTTTQRVNMPLQSKLSMHSHRYVYVCDMFTYKIAKRHLF